MEKHFWSPYEDNILRFLRQENKLERWTDIARTLADQYKIKGKNGKHCKERFQSMFDSTSKNSDWPFQQQKILFALHNEMGNKWAIISRKMHGKTDNSIKNHFYSRLRKGLKKMNKVAEEQLGKSFKQIKFAVLFKIIEATEDGFKDNRFCQKDTSNHCFELKNKLIVLSYQEDEEHDYNPQEINCTELYTSINSFSRSYKRKPKKFRRIPTKTLQINERQNEQVENENSDDKNNQQNEQQSQRESSICDQQIEVQVQSQKPFKQFKEEIYRMHQMKTLKRRRESADTVGIESVLVESGIMEQEMSLPMLFFTKKRTSYFDLLSEQSQRENMFFDECELNADNFVLRDLLSMKRLSQTDQRFFD